MTPPDELNCFPIGTTVRKKGVANWRGTVCGHYATGSNRFGIAVESWYEPGSVQIYPNSALVVWEPPINAPNANEAIDVLQARISALEAKLETERERADRAEAEVERLNKQITPLDCSAWELADWAEDHASGQRPLPRYCWEAYATAIRIAEDFECGSPSSLSELEWMVENGLCRKGKVPLEDDGDQYPEMCEPGDDFYELTHLGHAFCDAAHSIVCGRATALNGENDE